MNNRHHFSALKRRHLAACLVVALGVSDAVQATTYHVQDCTDGGGANTLRSLLTNAMDGDVIQVDGEVCGHISLSGQAAITVASNVTLAGSGADQVIITGGQDAEPPVEHAIFYHTASGTFQISGVTLRDAANLNPSKPMGGCVSSMGSLTVQNSVLSNCVVDPASVNSGFPAGGAIYTKGSLTLVHSTVTGNRVQAPPNSTVEAGGIYARTNADIEYSTISDNTVVSDFGEGGGMFAAGVVQIRHSTITGNYAAFAAGVDIFATANVTIAYSTISDNTGIVDTAAHIEANFTPSPYKTTFLNSTISGNRASYHGTVYTDMPTVVNNTTIAFNHAAYTNVAAGLFTKASLTANSSIFSNNENFDVQAYQTSVINGSAGNLIVSTDASVPLGTLSACPKLEALAANGGSPETLALQSDSPAINQGNLVGGALTTDERGAPRNVGGVDIGAYERQASAPADDRIFLSAFSGRCN